MLRYGPLLAASLQKTKIGVGYHRYTTLVPQFLTVLFGFHGYTKSLHFSDTK